jgi:hypothetical protein
MPISQSIIHLLYSYSLDITIDIVYAALGKNQVPAVNTNTKNVNQPKRITNAMFRYIISMLVLPPLPTDI